MSIINWQSIDHDGMPAFKAALKALEAAQEDTLRDTAKHMNALHREAQGLADRLEYLDARRKDDRIIREEIDARLRVIEEQVANMATALTELTHDTQTDLRILEERMMAPKLAERPCAFCHDRPATTGPDGKLCANCLADLTAGIEEAGLSEMRVRRPAYHIGVPIGGYCHACETAVLWPSDYRRPRCEYCGGILKPITQFRDDRRGLPVMPFPARAHFITQAAVDAAFNGNGHVFTPGYPAEDGADV